MKLKDTQSGEVNDYTFSQKVGEKSMIVVNLNGDLDNPIFFNSLRELCERFEDAPEEKPFEEVAKPNHELQLYAGSIDEFATRDGLKQKSVLRIADSDYYEILPDGTKKTKFTWDEAMEIEKKTHGKWRVPTVPEWFAICAAFGQSKDGTDVDPQVLKKNLNLATDEDGYCYYWSAASHSTAYSYSLNFNSSYLYPRGGNYKGNGFAVRCVAPSV